MKYKENCEYGWSSNFDNYINLILKYFSNKYLTLVQNFIDEYILKNTFGIMLYYLAFVSFKDDHPILLTASSFFFNK